MPPVHAAHGLNAPRHVYLAQILQDWAKRTPDAPAILAPGYAPLTYGRLYQHITAVRQGLRARGLGHRDRIALVLPDGPEMAVACLAVATGMACAPLNPAYSADDFAFYLTAVRPKALLLPQGMDSPVRAVAHALHIQAIELLDMPEAAAGLFTLTGAARPPDVPPDVPPEWATADDIALLLPTGGTTSRPKIVPLTHANLCTAVHNLRIAYELTQSDRCLNVMPLFHLHALGTALLVSLVAGASIVCPPGFDVQQFFACLEEFSPSWYTAVSTIHAALVAHAAPYRDIIARHPLRFIRAGSAALPPQVRAGLEQVFQAHVLETYGMTEASGHITCNPPPQQRWRPGSAGLVMGPDIAIMDEHGALVPPGQIGEIVVRGPTVMAGYLDDPETNRHTFTHGWLRSGDQGYLDVGGHLFVTGRLKEMINRGGEKIAPEEVEAVLIQHPAVAQAVAFAMPHPRLGEDIAAAVVLHRQAPSTTQDIRLFAARRLAEWKAPHRVYIVEELPRTSTGKLQRVGLAERFGLLASDADQPAMGVGATAPRTPTEELLSRLWAQVFGLDRVGIHDDFFLLGGDSLLAMQLATRIRATWDVALSSRSFFEAPTIVGMARSIEAASQGPPSPQVPALQPVSKSRPLPLSFAQERLWCIEQLAPGRAVYNLPLAWRFSGTLNVAALAQSLAEMVRRHAILRTIFPALAGKPVQVIVPALDLPLPVVDLQSLPPTEHEATVQRLAIEAAQRPFDLTRGPLLRATLLRVHDQDHVLLLTLHHIIFDGLSTDIFWREVAMLYSAMCTGQAIALPPPPLQYADFAVWQRQWLQGEVLEVQLAYWQQRLGAHLPGLEIPTDRPRPPIPTFQGGRQSVLLPVALSAALKALSQREGVTLFMMLVAAFQTLLYRYTGQTDLVVGTPMAGRTRAETEGLLGCFVNLLILRTDLTGQPRFRELLRRVREVTLEAYDHQELPFETLVEALQPVRDLSRNPLVQVVIALQPAPAPVAELPELTVRPVTIDPGTAKFDLTLLGYDTEQGLLITAEYNTDLFDRPTITALLSHFHCLLAGIIANPEQRLADLPLLTAMERQQRLVECHTTAAAPPDSCLHQRFEAQVHRSPDAVAVVCNAQQVTYSALNQQANQLAHHLQALGVGPEVCVGLCVQRSLEMVVGLLGILKAGGAYVPLDPAYPAERLATMMADAQVTVVVTQPQCRHALPAPGVQVVCLDTDQACMTPQLSATPVSGVTPANRAYVMYTSGSTGRPKGVMVEHRQALALLHGIERVAPGGKGGIGTAVCPLGFDVSVWECFSMLCFGGMLHILWRDMVADPAQVARYLMHHRITSAYIPPVLLADVATHLEQQHAQVALKRLLVGVEPIPQDTLQRFRKLSEQMHIVNGYGPTETTVCATLFPFRTATEPGRRTPIGTTIDGYAGYLVDANMELVPTGIPGTLLIGGAGLARGYINHPALTAERFIPHPFSTALGARLYTTGDLARSMPDGNLEFLGRRDQQVKLHGYRIELEEIEAALRQHPAVRETAVVARHDSHDGDRHLVAYVVAHQERTPTPGALRTVLLQRLPAYMVPAAFVMLDALPRTPSGKVDRQALAILEMTPALDAECCVAPRTPVEYTLARIWAEVLGLEQVGVHDNFFALGGDSIRSIQVVSRAKQAGLQLTPADLFQHQTIAALAAVAEALPTSQTEPGVATGAVRGMPTQPDFSTPDLPELSTENIEALYPLSPMQQGILFHTLVASEPGTYCAQWSCTLYGPLHVSALRQAWQRVIERHPALRTAFHWESRDEPLQMVYRQIELPWQQYDWQDMPAVEQERQIEALLAADRAQGFAPSTVPLMRLSLIRLAEQSYQCIWSVHHLLVDGWSVPLILQEMWQVYEACRAGRTLHLAASRPYADYIAWLQQQDLAGAEAFWRQTLRGFTAPTALHIGPPHDSASSATARYAEQQIALSAATTTALQAMAQQHHLSVNTLVQGAWALLLSRYSGEADVVFGTTVAGRPTDLVGVESMVGLFLNTLPVRVWVRPEARLCAWLQDLQSQQAEARQYEYSPLVQVQGWSDVPRGLPLFESLLVFENYPARTALQAWHGSLELRRMRFISGTHYPLTVVAVPDCALSLRLKYDCHRFAAATITRMLGHLRTLLEGMIADPAQRLANLPMLTTAEQQQLLGEGNNTALAMPQDRCLHQWFEDQAARTPDAVAVVCEEQALTYQELNMRANKLARYLQALGVGPEVLVGIYLERSVEMVLALLGIIKAGGAYVALDPVSPQERLTGMVRDAPLAVLLTLQRLGARHIAPQTQVVCLDTDWQRIAQESGTNLANQATPAHLVYVMYTSGSTGIPRGVAVEHRQLTSYLYGVLPRLGLPPAASFALVSSLAADLGHTMVFGALCTGGCLHVLAQERVADPHGMAAYFARHTIDCLKIVPSHLAALHTALQPDSLSPHRLLILGGEAAGADCLEGLRQLASGCAILNHYGPTEATVGVLTYRVAANARVPLTSPLPLGRPLAHAQVYVLDQQLRPVPIGVRGEVCIGGASLARGYHHEPALTAAQFIPHPFSNAPGARLYKTGDLARYLPDSNLAFLGRRDNQVKLRGYRIELGEIETVLEHHPAIRQAVVLMREDTAGDRRLVAYCVPHHGLRPDMHEWRSFLQTQLPAYMMPAAFVVLAALPLTPHGKVDRQALPAPDQTRPALYEAFVAPRTPIEELLAGIWASVLGLAGIGVQENFFALGGHSLLAMRVMSRLKEAFRVDIPLQVLFEAPTIASLARHVAGLRQTVPHSSAPTPQAMPQEGVVPLTMTQEHFWSLDQLLPGAPFANMPYAVRLTGPLHMSALELSCNAVIQRHAILRTTFPTRDGRPVQVTAPTLHLPLHVEDLRVLPEAEREARAQQLLRVAALYPFNLQSGPLLMVWVLRLSDQEHILLMALHHIISDGWSRDVLLRELSVLYGAFCQGHPSPLQDLPLQYADFALWQQQWLHSEAGTAQLAYWTRQLRDPLPVLTLPADRPRTGALSVHTARHTFQLPGELCAALTRLSHQESTTLFMTLLAAFKTLVYSYTGQDDIRVGTPVANRQHQHTEGLIGLFANLVILRTSLHGNPTLRQVLQRVRTTTLEAYAHQELPFEYLARTFERVRHLDRVSLFQVMFSLQNVWSHCLELPALTSHVLPMQALEITPCELVVSLHGSPGGLDGVCLYKTALFEEATIIQMLRDFEHILGCLIAQPQQLVATFGPGSPGS